MEVMRQAVCLAAVIGCSSAWVLQAQVDTLPPLEIAEIRKLGSVGTPKYDKLVPEGLRLSKADLETVAARQRAEAEEIGYVPRITPFKAGHSFGGILDRYWKTDRTLFGLMPSGVRGVEMKGSPAWFRNLSKMCVSNERLVDEKIAEWVKAGKPECLRCGENDGLLGYCRCEKCRALDADLPGERFVHHKSDRYVDFWNRIAEKARALRPDVKVTVHLYSVLRHPPRKAKVKYPDNMMCSYVPSLHDADPVADIRAWKAAGLKNFFTRPNWLCTRSVLPMGLERRLYDVHRGLFAAGSKGMDEDPTPGNPAIGFEICMLEHLCADPNVPFEKIEDYWCGRFGAAKETVRDYYRTVRARCDREWPKYLKRLRDLDIEFLDDGHFCRTVHELHTVAELEADLAILERFDASRLTGEAARQFADLKTCARHYVITKKTLVSKSPADKAALTDFRIANRAALGTGWNLVYTKGEVDLWCPERNAYMDLGIESFVEKTEELDRLSTVRLPQPEISRVAKPVCSATKSSIVPEGLRYSAEEAKAITARLRRESEEAGYVERIPYHSGHYTSRLIRRFWDTRRDFFGLMPNGVRGVDLKGEGIKPYFRGLSKACVSNEDVVDQKIADWVAAGKPQLFIAGEDDGLLGYCRCEKCRALDADLPGERFVHHKTDRYINFWNRLTAKAVKLRPDVMVTVFAYSVLRHPPRRERIAYPDNMRFSFVPTFHDTDKLGMVAAWKRAGMKHFYMRPNYLCARNHMPYGIERTVYDEIRAFMDAGASGFQFDGSREFPNMAFEIYVAERLSADPNVSFARIEHDFCARFGAAAKTVQAYYARVRARCDREWPRLVQWLRENDLEFLDDGHFCRYVDRLHTVGEFEDDLLLLETFRGELKGEAARRFADLKACVRHQILAKRAYLSKSGADKQALLAFRLANRDALGWGFGNVYRKGEAELWDPASCRMQFGSEAFVEKYELSLPR